jgi:hypothetical protein
MTKTLDDIRLADVVFSENKSTSFFTESQFPAIYREQGRELIELVKSYYQFLETQENQSVYNIRRIYEYRNIDTTLDRMLLFFKDKFLNGLFFEEDSRFIVKNILDLYRRKGSKEGIELFFKLFFDSEVNIYYPSQDMFKPSQSIWNVGSFIQLYPVETVFDLEKVINRKIYGDKSNAEAFVDNVYFVNIQNSYVPIIFISQVKSEFIGFDRIYSLDPLVTYGRVYGSMRSVEVIDVGTGSGDNKVGDIVEIVSPSGFGAKGRVSKVTEELSGEIQFAVKNGNYGYTLSNTDIIVSDQNLFFTDNESLDFAINERIRQEKAANTYVFGTVIGKNVDAIGITLDFTELETQVLSVETSGTEFNPNEEIVQVNSFGVSVFGFVIQEDENEIVVSLDKAQSANTNVQRYFFEANREISTVNRITNITKQVSSVEDQYFISSGFPIETVSRQENISRMPLFVTEKNLTASASIGTITNTETITIVTDIIENYLDVPLSSNNYSEIPPALLEMSGTRVNSIIPDLDTPLNEAFVPETFTIGTIETLLDINPGFDHQSDVFVLARENLIRRFNLTNQILNVSVPQGVILFEGDSITQTKEIQSFEGNTSITEVKGDIVKIEGDNIFVKQTTFESFIVEEPVFKVGSNIPITINSRSRDNTSLPMGLNAIITGDVETVVGKIIAIDIIDSGIGYEDGSIVSVINVSKENNTSVDAVGIANARRQGITEGRWRSFESHPNSEKRIQDSFFYQDFSYEITTDTDSSVYEDVYRKVAHPAGLKLFTSFGKIDSINIDTAISNPRINTLSLEDFNDEFYSNTAIGIITDEDGFQYLDNIGE